jgi:carbamoylphosphate synthase large subunit|tara:strand:- start:2182 stop:3351 length:1170 start_codon:yes stop_codon:yes gene_type:complete
MRVLLIDTNFSSTPIYEYLLSLKHQVFTIGRNPQDFMAKSYSNYIEADYTDIETLKNTVKEYSIDRVVPGCNDYSYEVCCYLEGLTMNVDSIDKIHTLVNKKSFRAFGLENGLPVPRVFNLDELKVNTLQGPIIIKPSDSFSGKGVTRLDTYSARELDGAVNYAVSSSRDGSYVIEEFVEGQLYSHSAFIKNGVIVKDFLVEEYGSVNPFVVDTSYVNTDFSRDVHFEINKDIERIVKLLKLSDGLIHTQFILRDDKYWLIETTRRCPGDLYSQLIEISTGFNYSAMYASFFVGEQLEVDSSVGSVIPVIRHTVTQDKSGIFDFLRFTESVEVMRYISISVAGDYLHPSPGGRVGILFINSDSEITRNTLVNQLIDRSVYQIKLVREAV